MVDVVFGGPRLAGERLAGEQHGEGGDVIRDQEERERERDLDPSCRPILF